MNNVYCAEGYRGDVWYNGPEQALIHEKGYAYLKEEFPELSYINTCRIATSVDEL